MSKITAHELALVIQILEQRRIYFESRNPTLASEVAIIISKLGYP